MERKRIAIDMDDVMANISQKFLVVYEREMGVVLTKEEYWGKKIYQINGGDRIREFLFDKGFFADLPVMPGSQDVVRELTEDFDVFITTAAMEFRHSLEDKYDWLLEHFPFINWKNYVFCGDKSIIGAEYMIDDHVFNLQTFRGKGLLFTASHNIYETEYTRVDNWEEVRTFFHEELKSGK